MPFGGTMLPWWALPQFLWLAGLRRDGRDGRPSWRGCTSLGLRCASFATVSGDGVRVAQAGTRGSRSRRAGGTAPTWSRSAWSGSAPTSPWTTWRPSFRSGVWPRRAGRDRSDPDPL